MRTHLHRPAPVSRITPSWPPPARAWTPAAAHDARDPWAGAPFQRQPIVSSPADPLEREADAVAARVTQTAEPAGVIQRKCAQCSGEEGASLQAKAAPSAGAATAPGTSAAVGAAVSAAQRAGAPLPEDSRAYFEQRFGHDFRRVRIHADGQAAEAARGVGARAYTLGSSIVFGDGEYARSSEAGRRLLAHELTHVVQQTGGAPGTLARAPVEVVQRVPAGSQIQRDDDGKKPPPSPSPSPAPAKEEPKKDTNCRDHYLVESWDPGTCCSNQGFPDPDFTRKSGAACCNTFPAFVDAEAVRRGFDGAASCRSREYLGHRARVFPAGQNTPVDVLCVDTRRKKDARVIELGFNAAMKAYGTKDLLERARVCIGDTKEVDTCHVEKECNDTVSPGASDCVPGGCSKAAPPKAAPKADDATK